MVTTRPGGQRVARSEATKQGWIPVASHPDGTGVGVNNRSMKNPLRYSGLQAIHQIGAVMRYGEYRPEETTSVPPGAGASAQPLRNNPRKQRKNPAAAGSGERFRGGKWRRGWDSNPRDAFDAYSLSRGAPSTTRPPLRWRPFYRREVAKGKGEKPWPVRRMTRCCGAGPSRRCVGVL